MFKIALCDDSPDFLALIEEMVQSIFKGINPAFKLIVRRFDQGQELIDDLSRGSRYDLILLDWDMPGQNGEDTGKVIRRLDRDCLIIFVTSFDQYAMQALKLTTLRYITKDNLKKDLPEALQTAYDKMLFNDMTIQIKETNTTVHLLKIRDIISVENQYRKVTVCLKQREKIIAPRSFLREHSLFLLQNGFVKPYQGILINVREITKLNHIEVILSDGSIFPMSRKYKKDVFFKVQQMMRYET